MRHLLATAFMPLALTGAAFAQDAEVDTRSPEMQALWPPIPTAPPCLVDCPIDRYIQIPDVPFIFPAAETLYREYLAPSETHIGVFTRTTTNIETPISYEIDDAQRLVVAGVDLEAHIGGRRLRGTFFHVSCEFPEDVPVEQRDRLSFTGGATRYGEFVRHGRTDEGQLIQWNRIRGFSTSVRAQQYNCYVDYVPLQEVAEAKPAP